MLTLIAEPTIQAGKEQEFEAKMRTLVPEVREEPGNHAFIMHRLQDNPRVFMFSEEYMDRAGLGAHRRHLRGLGVDLRAVPDGPPVLEFYQQLA